MGAGAETMAPLHDLSSSFEDSLHKVALGENPLIAMEAVTTAAAHREGRPAPGTPDQASPGQLRPAPLGDPLRDKGSVHPAGDGRTGMEPSQHLPHRLPGAAAMAQERTMSTPRVAVQGAEVPHQPRPHRIEVEVAHEFEQIRLLLTQDGLVAVLEEVPMAMVASVERPRVSGEEAAHDRRQGDGPGAEQEVEVVGEQGPCVARRPGGGQHPTQPLDEGGSVGVIPDDRSPLDSPADNMVQDPGCIQTYEARHGRSIGHEGRESKSLFHGCPLLPGGECGG